MTILTVSNLAVDFGGASTNTTSTTERDPNFSPNSITMQNNVASTFGWGTTPASDDLWFHFRVRTDVNLNSNADGYWMSFYNANNQRVARIDMTNANIFAVAYGDSTVNGNQVAMAANTIITIDVRISIAGGDLTIEVYNGGGPTPVTTATSTNVAAKDLPTYVVFDNNDISGSNNAIWYYSEFIVTDGEDTRGWRLATLEPNVNANYNDWNGDVNEVGDSAPATTIQSDAGGQRQSWTNTAYAGPASPSSVRAVISKTQAARGLAGSPSQITQFLRIGGIDYDGSAQVIPVGGQQTILEVWSDDPSTTSPWNTTALAALESGLLSST